MLLYDTRIMHEYRDVLFRPKFPFELERLERFLQFVQRRGQFIEGANFAGRLPDPDDQCFADVAFCGGADLLITGNVKDFPVGESIHVITPRDWVNMREWHVRERENEDLENRLRDKFGIVAVTITVATACKRCGMIELEEIPLARPQPVPVRMPFSCKQLDRASPTGRCGGELWSYEDNDLGRRLAATQSIPIAPR